MKILVSIKRVPDFKATVRVKADGSGVDTAQMKMVMNPFDEIAVEEAVRLKEKGKAQEIVVVSIGPEAAQETLRVALAMGADRGILLHTAHDIQPLAAARLLQALVLKEVPQLLILGKQAVDTDDNQTGQMVAGLLQWPQGTFASAVEVNIINEREGSVCVTREIDGGLETLILRLPAVITTDLRLNEPRYISLPNIVQAKRKPMEMIVADSFGVDLQTGVTLLKFSIPEKRRLRKRVDSCAELVRCLKEEAKVLL